MPLKLHRLIAGLAASRSVCARRRRRTENHAARLHRARDRPDQGLRGRLQQDRSEHRAEMGARFHRRHHREGARRKSQPAGRRRRSARRRRAWWCSPTKACCGRTRRRASTSSRAKYSDPQNPPALGRHGRLWRCDLLQHGRGAEAQPAQAGELEGPDQARLQGPDRHAQSGVVGHRLPRRRRAGCRCGASRTRGSSWMRCTRTSRSHTHSGRKPCRQAGAGEFPIGISFEYRAMATKKSGAPVDIVFPTEGLGWDLEASRHHEDHARSSTPRRS